MEQPNTDNDTIKLGQIAVRLPRRLLFFSLAISLSVPYLARLPGVASHGSDWLYSYIQGALAVLFMSIFNAIPGGALYLIGRLSKKTPLAFWGAVASSTGYAFWAHGSMNLAASSTAAIGLVFIPVYCAVAAIPGAVLGWIAYKAIQPESGRRAIAWAACLGAVIIGVGNAMQNQAEVAQRESKFPVVSISELPLNKRVVIGCCEFGRIEVLALDNFDSEQGQEIAALSNDLNVLFDTKTYAEKAKTKMGRLECDHCVGMYPHIAADGKGSFVVASSDGVVDNAGRVLWRLNHLSFSKVVPLRLPGDGGLTFFSTETPSRLERHDAQGEVLWSFNGPFLDVGIFENADGKRLPAATMGKGKSSAWQLYDLDGKPIQQTALPDWANNVSSVAWPSRGHLLAGGGSWVGVLDPQGSQILLHQIQGTSFRPYHGPDGVAVRFNSVEKSYLAVLSHGSSGYARSVLLIFDSKGRLVWQEELKKSHAILAVPQADGKGDVLLVGGMDGVIEYSLDKAPTLNRE